MKLFKCGIGLTSVLLVSIYLTALINAEDVLSPLKAGFIFAYFIVVSIAGYILYRKYLSETVKRNKKIVLLAFILSVVFVLFIPKFTIPNNFQPTTVILSPTGSKDEASLGTEIRVTSIMIGKTYFDFNQINLPNGWEKTEDNTLLCYPNAQTQPLNIDFPRATKIDISFLSHQWSGILEVQDGSIKKEINLYSMETNDLIYTVKSNIQQPHFIIVMSSIVFWGILLLILFASLLFFYKRRLL